MNERHTSDGDSAERTTDPTEEQIVAQIEDTRSRMSGTIDEIGNRLNPQVVADQAREHIREATVGRVERAVNDAGYTAQQTGNTIISTIRENPVPAALAAVGIGWLAMRMRDQQSGADSENRPRAYRGDWYDRRPVSGTEPYSGSRYATEPRSGTGGTGEQVAGRAEEVGQQARQAADDIAGQARHSADDVRQQAERAWQDVERQAQSQAAYAQRQFDRTLNENPLALGALAVGVGAAVALAIPETQQEREALGPHRDRLVSEVERAASGALSEAERSASEALDETEQRARDTGEQMRQEARQSQP